MGDVTNMVCKPFATPNCNVETEVRKGTRARITTETVDIQECKEITVNIPHIKKVPVCRNVTKQNCVTNWEVVNGQKVWAVNEKCSPVTWQDCKLEEVEVDFPAQKVDCKFDRKEPYPTCHGDTCSCSQTLRRRSKTVVFIFKIAFQSTLQE